DNDNEWGQWTDVDGDCQNTREEVLIQQSEIPVSFKTDKQCEVAVGRWTCAFTGDVFTSPSSVVVARVLPLAAAYATGGQDWSAAKKVAFANEIGDHSHLIVVSAAASEARAARSPDSWLPGNQDYVCDYMQTWIETKMNYGLVTDSTVLKLHSAQCLGPVEFCGKTWPLETTEISCDDATITSLRPLARLKSLTRLELYAIDKKTMAYGSTQIANLKPLAMLANLRSLDLAGSKVSDITPLANLTKLTRLRLTRSEVLDLRPLAKLNQLVMLDLSDTPVSDVEPLAQFTKLASLNLSTTQISDVAPLARITTLSFLNLSATQISDVEPLATLALEHLVLDHTDIVDLTALAKFSSLEKLGIRGAKVSLAQIKKLAKAKPKLQIER
ncbi:MAG: hypothetical protein JKY56_01905, partial [Kofleriaceae bacterium]|nr:hypothetical protein [Kofleriaceae bacterium]